MPRYDFRCKQCHQEFALSFTSIAEYDAAVPQCPACGHQDLARLITQVAIPRTAYDYGNMSSQEMLSVLESGDTRQVNDLYQQVGGSNPHDALDLHQKVKSSQSDSAE